jgi:hypothetical protein
MENNNKDFKDMDYTVVLDRNYRGPVIEAEQKKQEAEDAKAVIEPEIEFDASKAEAEKIYETYESMFIKDYTALDKDDIYPHSYQWRVGDRYSEDKLAVVEAAIRRKKRIAETEEYLEYVEKVKRSKFTPMSWE